MLIRQLAASGVTVVAVVCVLILSKQGKDETRASFTPHAKNVPGLLALLSESMRCTAVRLPNDWILSAEHCNRGKDLQVCDARSGQCSAVEAIHGHPRLDVALFRADPPLPHPEEHMTWLPTRPLEVGEKLQLFGVGKRGEQAPQPSNPINVEVQGTHGDLTKVGSVGLMHPCWGDSGAPLLAEHGDGRPQVLAILVAGSPSCKGSDGVLPIVEIESWLRETAFRSLN